MAARGTGLDCIVIAKVMWQQGVGVRLHSYCQSRAYCGSKGQGFTVLCYCQSNVAARGRGLDYIVIAKIMWPQGAGV